MFFSSVYSCSRESFHTFHVKQNGLWQDHEEKTKGEERLRIQAPVQPAALQTAGILFPEELLHPPNGL